MIVVKLQGGMGNQMFQYAFGRAVAERNMDRLVLDATFLLDRTPKRDFVYRTYDLEIFGLGPELTFLSRLAGRLPVPFVVHAASRYGLTKIKTVLGIQKYVIDKSLGTFQKDVLDLEGDVYFDGYWQCDRYFQDVRDIIRSEFSYSGPLSSKVEELAERIRSTNSICVNVRRGDYVSSPAAMRTLGFVGEDYYRKGVEHLSGKLRDPHFFVFSDEIEWCQQHLEMEHPHTFVSHDYAGEKFGQYFHLMSSCMHFLIPNSSFAWWAAWLGRDTDKIVVAPRRWFQDPRFPAEDLVPEDWVRI